ncbi:hypothetical protein PVK06_002003 [Gossypium arboreum]|uniref:Uncharacterized protein n=1 Tax=Gossypium arboreum TaxID=29729 RepID=A0ABR0R2Q4_GOSAR|nr:hypothetical protein PVK06_002003 [Gossypium arboreum]
MRLSIRPRKIIPEEVSEELISKSHLQYLPKKRRFTLVAKVILVHMYHKESITHENCGVDEHVGESSLTNMRGTLEIKKLLLHVESIDQARVFKPGICYFGSFCGKLKHPKLCANNLFDVWTLTKEIKFNDSAYHLDSFLFYDVMLVINFLIHHKRRHENCLLDMLCNEKSIVDVGLIYHLQTLDMCVKGYSHAKLDLFDYVGFVELINSCATFFCISKSLRKKCDRFEHMLRDNAFELPCVLFIILVKELPSQIEKDRGGVFFWCVGLDGDGM